MTMTQSLSGTHQPLWPTRIVVDSPLPLEPFAMSMDSSSAGLPDSDKGNRSQDGTDTGISNLPTSDQDQEAPAEKTIGGPSYCFRHWPTVSMLPHQGESQKCECAEETTPQSVTLTSSGSNSSLTQTTTTPITSAPSGAELRPRNRHRWTDASKTCCSTKPESTRDDFTLLLITYRPSVVRNDRELASRLSQLDALKLAFPRPTSDQQKIIDLIEFLIEHYTNQR